MMSCNDHGTAQRHALVVQKPGQLTMIRGKLLSVVSMPFWVSAKQQLTHQSVTTVTGPNDTCVNRHIKNCNVHDDCDTSTQPDLQALAGSMLMIWHDHPLLQQRSATYCVQDVTMLSNIARPLGFFHSMHRAQI